MRNTAWSRARPGCSVSQSVVIFLNPTIFISNLIGDNDSLEQPAPLGEPVRAFQAA